jgi:hypothetical protein
MERGSFLQIGGGPPFPVFLYLTIPWVRLDKSEGPVTQKLAAEAQTLGPSLKAEQAYELNPPSKAPKIAKMPHSQNTCSIQVLTSVS